MPPLLTALARRSERAQALLRGLWLKGLSTRDLARESQELAGHSLSHQTIATDLRAVQAEILQWQNRPISNEFRYLMLDALYTSVTRGPEASQEAVHLVLGLTEAGRKEVLEVLVAPAESKASWASVLRRLELRGLKPSQLHLVVSDGHEGLCAAVDAWAPKVRRQRCVVHKMRNVLGNAPRKLKKEVGAGLSEIFDAPSRLVAEERVAAFITKWKPAYPALVVPLETDTEALFRYFDFPPRLWKALRTSNALERVNREFRRKLRDVGSLKGEGAALRVNVEIARALNTEWGDEPVRGFRQKRT